MIARVVGTTLFASLAVGVAASAQEVGPGALRESTLSLASRAAQVAAGQDVRPTGSLASEISLTLTDAIQRGLRRSMDVLVDEQQVRAAQGTRWTALSELLPDVTAFVGKNQQRLNLDAFGFAEPGLPNIVGPFTVFDARLSVSQPLLDVEAIYKVRSEAATVTAEQHFYRSTRDLVVFTVADLYLQAVTGASRLQTASARLATAEALLAAARRIGQGTADALRAEMRVQNERQRLTVTESAVRRQHLALARAIHLPPRHTLTLVDPLRYAPLATMTLEAALERAYQARQDYQGQRVRVQAAEAARKAASGARLPSINLVANYGTIGSIVRNARPTFLLAASVDIPLFEGRGEVLEADAELQEERARLEDLRVGIHYELEMTLLDLGAAARQVQAAGRIVRLAQEQRARARAQEAVGAASQVEVLQAEEAVAVAQENDVSSLYLHAAAKLRLARALGVAEESFAEFLGLR